MYGYVELKPPSTLLAPGAMVSVVSRDPYIAKIVCPPRASLGANWKVQESPTQEAEFKKKKEVNFNLDAKVLSALKADAKFQHISNITVSLSNPRLVELTDLDVFENMNERSQACWRAIEERRKAGFQISMISSGMMADISYTVEYTDDNHYSAEAKIAMLQDLAVSLGGGGSCVSTRTIIGKNLMFGVKDDLYLAALSMPDVDLGQVKRGSRLLDLSETPIINNETESPIIHPTDPVPNTCHSKDGCEGYVPATKTFPAQPTRPKGRKLTPVIFDDDDENI